MWEGWKWVLLFSSLPQWWLSQQNESNCPVVFGLWDSQCCILCPAEAVSLSVRDSITVWQCINMHDFHHSADTARTDSLRKILPAPVTINCAVLPPQVDRLLFKEESIFRAQRTARRTSTVFVLFSGRTEKHAWTRVLINCFWRRHLSPVSVVDCSWLIQSVLLKYARKGLLSLCQILWKQMLSLPLLIEEKIGKPLFALLLALWQSVLF